MFTRLRVLELASVLAGPSVGQFFAELGAEVIKVENPHTGGDVTRSWKTQGEQTDDRSAYFCSCNWGKKSIALDLRMESDRQKVWRLAEKSELIIASYKPGDAEKLGVSYKQLKATNPGLIYGQITGYGSDDDRVGYDAVIQAESGFMDLNGEKGGPPTKMPVALIDVLAAHQLKEGLLLALLKKEKTGEGSLVEVSLIHTAISSLTNQATNWLIGGKLPGRQGSAHPNIAPYGDTFRTKDGKRILLAVGNDKQFEAVAVILELDGRVMASSYKTNQLRVENREALNRILAKAIEERASDELLGILQHHKIPAGLVHNLQEVFDLRAASDIQLSEDGIRGVRTFVAAPSQGYLSPPPHLGEHSEEILQLISQ